MILTEWLVEGELDKMKLEDLTQDARAELERRVKQTKNYHYYIGRIIKQYNEKHPERDVHAFYADNQDRMLKAYINMRLWQDR